MSITQDARLQPEPAAAKSLTGLAGTDFGHPAAWVVAFFLIVMPLIANGFFLIEIFGTTLILGIVALSLMFLAGYGGMVSLMQLTIAGLAGYMTAVLGASGNANISLGWPWWLATPMALAAAAWVTFAASRARRSRSPASAGDSCSRALMSVPAWPNRPRRAAPAAPRSRRASPPGSG